MMMMMMMMRRKASGSMSMCEEPIIGKFRYVCCSSVRLTLDQ